MLDTIARELFACSSIVMPLTWAISLLFILLWCAWNVSFWHLGFRACSLPCPMASCTRILSSCLKSNPIWICTCRSFRQHCTHNRFLCPLIDRPASLSRTRNMTCHACLELEKRLKVWAHTNWSENTRHLFWDTVSLWIIFYFILDGCAKKKND